MDSENTINCVEPVYFKNSDVPVEKDNWLSNWEVCMASEYVINPDKKGQYTEAAQKIGDLWRIYLNDETARVNLLMQGIILRGMHIEVKDKNPFVTPGFESFQTTRLFIRNIPLSFDINTIANAIRNKGDDYLSTTSKLKNNDEVEEDETESESDTDQNKTLNQVIKNTITDHEQVTPKPVSQKIDKQTLMTAFVESNLQPAKSGSRPASPAGRRKLADRSPEDSLLQKGKKTKQDGKNK